MTDRIRLNEDNRRWWTLGAMCFALFMIMLDNTVVNVALPSIQRRPRRVALRPRVDGQRLHADLRRPARHRRPAGRHLRPPPDVPVRRRRVRALERGDRPRARPGLARRRPRHPGHRRRVHDARRRSRSSPTPSRREERGKAIGTWAGVSALALAIGPVVGGALAEYVSWRAIFFLNLPGRRRRRRRHAVRRARVARRDDVAHTVDFPGIAALSVGLTALVLALVEGNAWGWGSPEIVALLARRRGRRSCALRGARAARRASRWSTSASSARARSSARTSSPSSSRSRCSRCSSSSRSTCRTSWAISPLEAGVRFLPSTLMIMVVAPLAGRLADRVGPRPLMVDRPAARRRGRLACSRASTSTPATAPAARRSS